MGYAMNVLAAGAGTSLDPVQPILLPDAAMAKNPLAHLGGNGPWTAGELTTLMSLRPRLIHHEVQMWPASTLMFPRDVISIRLHTCLAMDPATQTRELMTDG